MPSARTSHVAKKNAVPRRSACAVACSLDIFGDRWTLLIIRDLFFGRTRFKDFTASPEGIPTNILTERLERLLAHRVIEQIPAEDGTRRLAYRLTEKGKALAPVLKTIRDWGLAWDKSTRAMGEEDESLSPHARRNKLVDES